MIRFTSTLRDLIRHLKEENLDVPEYIGITKKAALELRGELASQIQYKGDNNNLEENEMILLGIKVIAPKGFHWK